MLDAKKLFNHIAASANITQPLFIRLFNEGLHVIASAHNDVYILDDETVEVDGVETPVYTVVADLTTYDGSTGVHEDYTDALLNYILFKLTKDESYYALFKRTEDNAYRKRWRAYVAGKTIKGVRS